MHASCSGWLCWPAGELAALLIDLLTATAQPAVSSTFITIRTNLTPTCYLQSVTVVQHGGISAST